MKILPVDRTEGMAMNLGEVKALFRSITAEFFTGAKVRYAEQTGTKPEPPYVILKFGAVRRTVHPTGVQNDGRRYPCSVTAEVNLYTRGRRASTGRNATDNYENTAVSDLLEFTFYLDSPGILDRLAEAEVSVMLREQVRDLSFLEHDTAYRYRAMAEFDVSYLMNADGWYGVLGSPAPNSSGGGTEKQASEVIETIEEAEVEEII